MLTQDNYYDVKHILSASSLKYLYESPYKYQKYLEGVLDKDSRGNLDKDTQALRFGAAYHLAVLEHHKYPNEVVIFDKLDGRTKEGKEQAESLKDGSFFENNKDKVIIESTDADMIQYMYEELEYTGLTSEFEGGKAEEIFYTEIEVGDTIIPLKGKVDYYVEGEDFIKDLKTTSSNVNFFEYEIKKYHYDLQAYVYRLLTGKNMRFIVQSKGFLHPVAVYDLVTEKFYESGKQKFELALQRYLEYFSGVTFVEPRQYVVRREL